jgi:FAD/FMN-containing dehydrogenase
LLEAMAGSALSSLALPGCATARPGVVNDVSQLNPVTVAPERRPHTTDEVQAALRAWTGPVSLGGGRFSMGGQIAAPESLHLDLRTMNRVVALDPQQRVIRVQAGITWRDIQDTIDPHDLSVRIMQSYSNFTVGGSVSVNCHGRYVGRGPLVNSVRAVQLVTADAQVLELTRAKDPELFSAVFGGYGGLGVVTEVELELDSNARLERRVQDVALAQYPSFFRAEVLTDSRVVLHNADLIPPRFDAPRAISWVTTDKPLTQPHRLVPRGLNYTLEKNLIWTVTELPGGSALREQLAPQMLSKPMVTWRNHEASLDTASLEPRTRSISTYLLQEYFIPTQAFLSFAHAMARILRAHHIRASRLQPFLPRSRLVPGTRRHSTATADSNRYADSAFSTFSAADRAAGASVTRTRMPRRPPSLTCTRASASASSSRTICKTARVAASQRNCGL